MLPPVFFVPPVGVAAGALTLPGDESHHARTVLRLQQGTPIVAVDGCGTAHFGTYYVDGKNASMQISESCHEWGEAARAVTLAAGLSGGSKFDQIIQMGTEIGISRFVPLLTEKSRTINQTKADRSRQDRWRRVAVAAMKQSRRSRLPEIDSPQTLEQYLNSLPSHESNLTRLLFHPGGDLIDAQLFGQGRVGAMTVITGPESGFAQEEIELARLHRCHIVSLGDRILRAETAAPVVAALAIYALR